MKIRLTSKGKIMPKKPPGKTHLGAPRESGKNYQERTKLITQD